MLLAHESEEDGFRPGVTPNSYTEWSSQIPWRNTEPTHSEDFHTLERRQHKEIPAHNSRRAVTPVLPPLRADQHQSYNKQPRTNEETKNYNSLRAGVSKVKPNEYPIKTDQYPSARGHALPPNRLVQDGSRLLTHWTFHPSTPTPAASEYPVVDHRPKTALDPTYVYELTREDIAVIVANGNKAKHRTWGSPLLQRGTSTIGQPIQE
ncbi:hypothetical protein FQA39_LY01244 [Lamprigera yunnana]|nr:hypothetical protein FQA39_LY01244 [Lamprigera yunnana]